MTEDRRADDRRRVNRVMDYITAHLNEPLSLETLAALAAYSPFHFHRLFAAVTGETLGAFVRRVRLERAATVLRLVKRVSVTEVALDAGFSSPAAFTRAFKEHLGMSPTAWRETSKPSKADGKDGLTDPNQGKAVPARPSYLPPPWARKPTPEKEDAVEVRLETRPALRAVYIRRIGPFQESARAAWAALCAWAGPRGLLNQPGALRFSMTPDDPDITDADKLRYDACLTVGAEVKVDGEVGLVELPACQVAIGRYEGPSSGIAGAWHALYAEWLPTSGFQPANAPCIEVYLNDPTPERFSLDIQIPVIPA